MSNTTKLHLSNKYILRIFMDIQEYFIHVANILDTCLIRHLMLKKCWRRQPYQWGQVPFAMRWPMLCSISYRHWNLKYIRWSPYIDGIAIKMVRWYGCLFGSAGRNYSDEGIRIWIDQMNLLMFGSKNLYYTMMIYWAWFYSLAGSMKSLC